MFTLSFPVLVFCLIAGGVQCRSSLQTTANNASVSACGPQETQCLFGCCPYPNAVCCIDGFQCCQSGQICIPIIGLCIALDSNENQPSLTTEKTSQLRNSVLKCPPGMSDCEPHGCCPWENATCCNDGEHCCPSGYWCDIPNMRCISEHDSTNFEVPLSKTSKKPNYKSCAGGRRMCPGYMDCCVDDAGEWGCCPDPSLPHILYGNGDCCDSVFGSICCPDEYPTCTLFGCSK